VRSSVTNNHAYNQPVYSDDEELEVLTEHFATTGLAVCTPLSSDEDLRTVNLNACTIANCQCPVDPLYEESRFLLNTCAPYHISPERSDFKTLTPILLHPVNGPSLAGDCLYAMGRGTIDLLAHNTVGRKLTLHNVLFVPFARARLISVPSLGNYDMYTCHFDSNSCRIADKSGITVARGTLCLRDLYVINVPILSHFELASLRQGHTHAATGITHASRTPDIETWHRRLGHCDIQTIIDMARNHAIDGMTIDLPIAPFTCVNCVFGKQARLPAPGERESVQAKRPLERVYMHLWGPMSVTSQSGRLFAMIFVDDFSSYVWTVPLRSKDEAAKSLRAWKCAIENVSEHRLKTLVAKDGLPVISQSILDWFASHNIEYQVSAHNERTMRIHHMVFENSRALLLACNAHRSLWDEFLTTSAYLTTLTALNNLDVRTPYELWNGRAPSLSHLHEIGCLVFALIATQIPNTYQYSEPCILIGYEPRAKKYRLWDPAKGKVFKSSHALFIERLDTVPTNLKPGATFSIASTTALPSWDAPISAAVFTVSTAKQNVVQV